MVTTANVHIQFKVENPMLIQVPEAMQLLSAEHFPVCVLNCVVAINL